jgi:hypothetical protein
MDTLMKAAQEPVYWPGPGGVASPRTLAAVLAAAGIGGTVLTLSRPGLDWLLVGLAIAGVAGFVQRGTRPFGGARATVGTRWIPALASLALLGVGAVRADGWITGYCLLAALGTGSVALSGGRTLKGLLFGAGAGAVAAVRAVPWLSGGVARVRAGAHLRGGPRLARTLLISIGLIGIFGGLFVSADPAFASLAGRMLPRVDGDGVTDAYVGTVLAGLLAAGTAFLAAARPRLDELPAAPVRTARRLEWVLPVAGLDLLFLGFVLVQLTVLFGGRDHVLGTAGLTYAQYARSGFWQLVAVTLLTLAVIGVVARVAPRQERVDRILVRVLLGGLAGLSLVIVASAVKRLAVYEEAYGFTRLRVLVGATELWLGLLFGMVLLAGVRLRGGWMPRAVAASAVLALLGVAAVGPDRFVADHNLDRYQQTGRIDTDYLARLSPDAVPALLRLPPALRGCPLAAIAQRLEQEPDGWRTWNLGRSRARALIAQDKSACSWG